MRLQHFVIASLVVVTTVALAMLLLSQRDAPTRSDSARGTTAHLETPPVSHPADAVQDGNSHQSMVVVDGTPPAFDSGSVQEWSKDEEFLARLQDAIRARGEASYASWEKNDGVVVQGIFQRALAKDATGSEPLACLRAEDFTGLPSLELQAIFNSINVAKYNLRELGPNPLRDPALAGTLELEFLARDMEEDPFSLPPEYVVRFAGYQFDDSLPTDLQQELRGIWVQNMVQAAPLKTEVDTQLSAVIGVVWEQFGNGTPIPDEEQILVLPPKLFP